MNENVHFEVNLNGSNIGNLRLHQERAVEKERQLQHIEYLKESNQTQTDALTSEF